MRIEFIFWLIMCTLSFPGQIIQKDQEIKELKQKIAEVMAVMPSIAYTAATSTLSPVTPHYSSKFVETSPSGLDPNASVYQPMKKWLRASFSCPSYSLTPFLNFIDVVTSCKSVLQSRWQCNVWLYVLVVVKKIQNMTSWCRLELPNGCFFSCKFLENSQNFAVCFWKSGQCIGLVSFFSFFFSF